MMKKKNSVLLYMVRLGIACLGIATLLYVFWPKPLNSFAQHVPIHQVFIDVIKNYPGFDQDWLSLTSLITTSLFIYVFLATVFIVANLVNPPRILISQNGYGREQWSLLPYLITGRLVAGQQMASNPEPATDYRSIFSIIRMYSKSREGIGSVALDFVTVIALTYIGYTTLQAPPTYGGVLVRFSDAVMVGLWCYCIFSIFMWLVFILFAWLRYLGRRV